MANSHGKPRKKIPRHHYGPGHRRQIDERAPISDRKIAQRRSIVKISNLADFKSAKFQKTKSFGVAADHAVRGYFHNGEWKCF